MLPSLTKDDLEYVVEFLYTGQISCPDQETVSNVLTNLSKLLGFPEGMDLSEAPVKSESTNYRANFRQSYEDNDSQFESPEDLGVGVKGTTGGGMLWKLSYEETDYDGFTLKSTGNSVAANSNSIKGDVDTNAVRFSLAKSF